MDGLVDGWMASLVNGQVGQWVDIGSVDELVGRCVDGGDMIG